MKKILLTTIFCFAVTALFAQTTLTIGGNKIDIKGKSAGKVTLDVDKSIFEDFYEISNKKVLTIYNVQTFVNGKSTDNKEVIMFVLNVEDLNTTFFEDKYITEGKTLFEETTFEITLYAKKGKLFKTTYWDRKGSIETDEMGQAVVHFTKMSDAKAFLKQLIEITK